MAARTHTPQHCRGSSISAALRGGAHVVGVALIAALIAAAPLAAWAQEPVEGETQDAPGPRWFVSDKLVLNVYVEPDQSSERLAVIETGDVLEEIERTENLVRVRLEDGREGWVGANYLSQEPPAAVQLRTLQREQKSAAQLAEKKAAAEIARLEQQSAKLQADVNRLNAQAAQAAVAAAAPVVRPPEAAPTPLPPTPARQPWLWAALAALAAALAGFALGYQTLARRIRNKYRGLKIY
jgi:SH3-like domain-containing protein